MNDPGAILILGAGATGLGAAYRLRQLHLADWRVLEAENYPGGLASSFVDRMGFTWDIGGHVLFSHYNEYDRMIDDVLGDERVWHERQAWVVLGDRFVPYPLQYNLHRLETGDRQRALAGLKEAIAASSGGPVTSPENFLAWINHTFGAGIAELFMVPYNTKVWGYPLETLGTSWIDERVAVPNLSRLQRNLELERDDMGWGPNRQFSYPLTGGTGIIWRRLAATLGKGRVGLGTSVTGVDLGCRTVSLADGRILKWEILVTSLPLDNFCNLCRDLDPEVRQAARSLIYSSCHIVGVGLAGVMPELLRGTSWVYFPRSESPYYRVTVLSNYSPLNAPPGCWSLMAEVCETPHRPIARETLGATVVSALRRDGLIPPDTQVASLWQRREEHGYPTPFLGRDDVLGRILPALEALNVYSRGRFGAWKYEVSNQDHSFMQGFEVINRILGLGVEVTLPDPQAVNQQP
ncbi:MAG TPA: FAD-dependent oxidoreductase [Thermoanaerobaculia bacterium]|nr:FAD-dependent oxidoreductase [Thermoanaerobaculia bacterium]